MSAILSEDRRYRYLLTRKISDAMRRCVFIMLNPSTADESQDDPTIRRCKSFAAREGCGTLQVVNLFAYRATTPATLRQVDDPIGPENDAYIARALRGDFPLPAYLSPLVVCAWGSWGDTFRRDLAMQRLLALQSSIKPLCLGVTANGQPKHPLYIRADQQLAPWGGPRG